MKHNNTIIAISPGETIQELLEDRGISQERFATKMNMSSEQVVSLICGETTITADIALQLEHVFGVPQAFWNNLESIYRRKLANTKVI